MVYHRILNIVPCAIQYDLIVYPSDLYWFASVNPQSPIFPSPTSFPPWQPQVRSLHLWVCFCFVDMFICVIFQIPHKSDSILFLTSLSLGPSMLLQMTLFHPYLWLSNMPLYICVCVCMCVHIHTCHIFINSFDEYLFPHWCYEHRGSHFF